MTWRWNRKTITAVAIVMVSVAFAAWMMKFTSDHDGESLTIGGDPVASTPATGGQNGGGKIHTGDTDAESGLLWVQEGDLPVEAQATLAIIERGGPFPYPNDGTTFGNLEGLLPERDRGYYREYTVITAGSSGRGARRIITGSGGEFFWTKDHYKSFERILRRGS